MEIMSKSWEADYKEDEGNFLDYGNILYNACDSYTTLFICQNSTNYT